MSSFLRSVILVMTAAMVINCAGPEPIRCGNLHGNSASQGFQSITSGFALSSSWISNPYRITGSSPVIGMDSQRREVLYIGTTNAKLLAIRSEDGTEKWQRRLGAVNSNTRIVSSASVSDNRYSSWPYWRADASSEIGADYCWWCCCIKCHFAQ